MSSDEGGVVSRERTSVLDFGSAIAFVAPGFIAFEAVSNHLPLAGEWLKLAKSASQPVGIFLFVVLASLSLGILVSGVRSLVLDWVYSLTGLHRPEMDYLALKDAGKKAVFDGLNENFYRYYQFYANSLVAVSISGASHFSPRDIGWESWPTIALVTTLVVVLFFSARVSLKRYYDGLDILFKNKGKQKND